MATSSLFINPIISSSLVSVPTISHEFSYFSTSRTKPISLIFRKVNFLQCERPKTSGKFKKRPLIAASKMDVKEYKEEEEEGPPPLLESEITSKPRRIAIFVEPSPFSYVSGYKNRFQNFIRYLREMGDEVMVVTTHEGVPQEFYGAKCDHEVFPAPGTRRCPCHLLSAQEQFQK